MTEVEMVLPKDAFKCNSGLEDLRIQPSFREMVSRKTKLRKWSGKRRSCKKRSLKTYEKDKNISRCSSDSSSMKRNFDQSSLKRKNRKKKKYKPYSKMSWSEKQQVAERDSKRANRIREKLSASGCSLAPYNTTQFLMEDHNVQELDFSNFFVNHRQRDNSNSMDSSEEFYSCPEDEVDFLQREFVTTYENLHAERLMNMTQSELVQEYMYVEDQINDLEKTLEKAKSHNQSYITDSRPPGLDHSAELEKIRVFREEIEKLTRENAMLEQKKELNLMHLSKFFQIYQTGK
ncbi:protein HEXIM1 [Caerostris extrusa]|uniref:Protein HEXIM1 n=1 Tax=Caerostris extrusa TaxID=172846 RepID=A0AAV4QQE5_CAEEX|nr:protein HEXIM1 [Caerostris extrusa]